MKIRRNPLAWALILALPPVLAAPGLLAAKEIGSVYQRVKGSVVVIATEQREVDRAGAVGLVSTGGLGSGVLVSEDGKILTAAHVVQTAEKILVQFLSGETIVARVIASEPAADVSLLQLERRPAVAQVAPLGDSDRVDVGDQVFVVGAPLGISHSLTVGHISARRVDAEVFGGMVATEMFQTDAAINEGNSGGPMFNLKGEVIGVVSYILSHGGGFEGLGFVITSNMARTLLLEQRSLWSGLQGFLLEGELAEMFHLPQESGLLVQHVARDSPAGNIGLKGGSVRATIGDLELVLGGDVILESQGVSLAAPDASAKIREKLHALEPGDPLRLKVLRGGKVIEMEHNISKDSFPPDPSGSSGSESSIMLRNTCLAIALLAFAHTVADADYYDGLAAFKRGDYEQAFDEWQPLAEQGFVEAQYQLARMYHRGYAVQDDALAVTWYRRAAEQGHLRAQNNLAVLYEQGKGVDRDEEQAARWYLRAAREGLIVARANLGVLYDEGRGVTEDPAQAAHWYRLAGEAGHVNSQYRLARLYSEGRGVPQDDGKAAAWYRKAAKAGHAESQLVLATLYENGRGVNPDPAKAAKWRRLAAIQGLQPDSPTPAASAEPAPDADEPAERPGSEMASAPADQTPANVEPPAVAAATGAAVEAPAAAPEPATAGEVPDTPPTPAAVSAAPAAVGDLAPALLKTHQAAQAGDLDAAYELARRYASGDGVPLSHKEAGKWYLSAAEGGHELAGYKIAFQYFRGRGIAKNKDLVRAHFWFMLSAERGVGDAAAWSERLAEKMNKRQLAESDALLADWKQRGAGG